MAKRRKKTTNKRMETRKNISIVMLIILSILLAVLIYGKTGYIGENLTPILGGMIGIIKFAIPVGAFVIAISIASDKKELASTKLIELLVFLTCLASIFSIYKR